MNQARPIQIAIDGPSGAGKSTLAKQLAKHLGIDYIDTGAMYRAIALKILRTKTPVEGDLASLKALLSETDVDFSGGCTLLDGEDVSELIRTPDVTAMASKSSAISVIREKLVALQRAMGEKKSVIMDGRDIGTNVFKDAEFKFFLTASSEVRARRRYEEILQTDPSIDYETVLKATCERDYNDAHRTLNPLSMAPDAIKIDTDRMDVAQVAGTILSHIEKIAVS
jgi:cytidylate kinase